MRAHGAPDAATVVPAAGPDQLGAFTLWHYHTLESVHGKSYTKGGTHRAHCLIPSQKSVTNVSTTCSGEKPTGRFTP
jgi:hypothetical protein